MFSFRFYTIQSFLQNIYYTQINNNQTFSRLFLFAFHLGICDIYKTFPYSSPPLLILSAIHPTTEVAGVLALSINSGIKSKRFFKQFISSGDSDSPNSINLPLIFYRLLLNRLEEEFLSICKTLSIRANDGFYAVYTSF